MSVVKADLVGVWSLKSFRAGKTADLRPWGKAVSGLLIYTDTNYVSAALNRNLGLPGFKGAEDSLFYAGTYRVEGAQVIHQVTLATSAQRIGASLVRDAVLQEGELTLSGLSETGTLFVLVWVRA